MHSKYDNMHINVVFYALICINNHVLSCLRLHVITASPCSFDTPGPPRAQLTRLRDRPNTLSLPRAERRRQRQRRSSPLAVRPCPVQAASLVLTDWARAPQVRHTSTLFYVEDLYLLEYFPHLSPPPSELSLGRVLRRLDRIHIVVQPVWLIVELPSMTHGLTPARTWTGGLLRLTLLGHPGSTETTHGTVVCLTALVDHYLTVVHPRISLP